MTFKQLTVLTGNSVSHLSNVISYLGGGEVNIRAHCLVDNGDGFCKLRMVVSEPEKAIEILQQEKLTAVVNDVVLIETDDKPGGLSRMLKLLEKGDSSRILIYSSQRITRNCHDGVPFFRQFTSC